MAEAVALFGLAANVIQFIDFGTRLTSRFWAFYKSSREQYDAVPDLKSFVIDLEEVLQSLKVPKEGFNSNDTSLPKLIQECHGVASDLHDLLTSLTKAKVSKVGKREALRMAFMSIWKEDEMLALQKRLDGFRSQLTLHLLANLREQSTRSLQQQDVVLHRIEAIHEGTRKLGDSMNKAATQAEGLGSLVLEFLISKVHAAAKVEERKHWHHDLINAILLDDTRSDTVDIQTLKVSKFREEQLRKTFMNHLRYEQMDDREERIAEAYKLTFHWIFMDQEEGQAKWSSFRKWLESDTKQLYWMTGKAGSGKSTLMKYIHQPEGTNNLASVLAGESSRQQSRCASYLETWASGSKLIIATFFFWNSGVSLEMSQSGLFRSLLSQILGQLPELIPLVSPNRWEALCLFNNNSAEWNEKELHKMLRSAIEHLPERTKMCLFIDGLDEFDGDHNALVSLFKDLLANRNIKLCVSSRPWVVFEDAFYDTPSLMLQDLTYNDIKLFITSELNADANFETLREREQEYADTLVEKIISKASGVFLWVRLVVLSLLAGMGHGDRIYDLEKRIDSLPSELERLYDKILDSLDPFYLEHAAQLFRLVGECMSPPSVLLLSFADEENWEFALKQAIKPLSTKEIALRVGAMRRRLNSRCKGFLEVGGSSQMEPNQTAQCTVQYLHRTVKDYIESEETQARLDSSFQSPFDPHLSLCSGNLSMLKTKSEYEVIEGSAPSWKHVSQFMHSASKVHSQHAEKVVALLDELDCTGSTLLQAASQDTLLNLNAMPPILLQAPQSKNCEILGFQNWLELHPCTHSSVPFGKHILSLAVRYGVVEYVRARANTRCLIQSSVATPITGGILSRDLLYPLLLDAISTDSGWMACYSSVPHPEMVQCLLEMGATFDLKHLRLHRLSPPWSYLVKSMEEDLYSENRIEKWKQIVVIALKEGQRGPSQFEVEKDLVRKLSDILKRNRVIQIIKPLLGKSSTLTPIKMGQSTEANSWSWFRGNNKARPHIGDEELGL